MEHSSACAVWLYARSGDISMSVLVDQMEELLKEAERREYTVVGTSQDQHNGYGIRRTGLKLMMGAVRSGTAHVVVVWDLARIGKDCQSFGVHRMLRSYGITSYIVVIFTI